MCNSVQEYIYTGKMAHVENLQSDRGLHSGFSRASGSSSGSWLSGILTRREWKQTRKSAVGKHTRIHTCTQSSILGDEIKSHSLQTPNVGPCVGCETFQRRGSVPSGNSICIRVWRRSHTLSRTGVQSCLLCRTAHLTVKHTWLLWLVAFDGWVTAREKIYIQSKRC